VCERLSTRARVATLDLQRQFLLSAMELVAAILPEMNFWYPGFLYGAFGVTLLCAALRKDARVHTLWERWRGKPSARISSSSRIALLLLGTLQITLGLLTGFGIVR
jgi:hypothetical protein